METTSTSSDHIPYTAAKVPAVKYFKVKDKCKDTLALKAALLEKMKIIKGEMESHTSMLSFNAESTTTEECKIRSIWEGFDYPERIYEAQQQGTVSAQWIAGTKACLV